MNSYALALLGLLADDKNVIPYRKNLRLIAGSVTASILLQQVVHRAKQVEWQPFYKFIEPCEHRQCNAGDTWTEELGFSRKEFRTAIGKIGTKCKAGDDKEALLQLRDGEEPRQRLVLYWTDGSRITWYQLNTALLAEMLKNLYLNAQRELNTELNAQRGFTEVPKGDLAKCPKGIYIYKETERNTERNTESSESSLDHSGDTAAPRSLPLAKGEECQIFDAPTGPKKRSNSAVDQPQRRPRRRVGEGYLDPRRLVRGVIPPGTGQTPIEVYHEFFSLAQSKLNHIQQDQVRAVDDLDRWRATLRFWAMSGYRPANVAGQLDRYSGASNGTDSTNYGASGRPSSDTAADRQRGLGAAPDDLSADDRAAFARLAAEGKLS